MINITFFSSGLRAAPLISYLYFLLQQYGYESLLRSSPGKPLLSVILVVGGKSLEKRCWGEKLSMMTPGFPQAYVFRVGG
jgi:hypothetical protein